MSASAIDLPVYNNLKSEMGDDFIVELVETYLADAPNCFAQMRTALQPADPEGFRRAAHSLKSTSASFGAMHLSALAKELELVAKTGTLEGVEPKLEMAASAWLQVEIALKELIHG
jgi:HPt (histidine-containing phosphotransfer) domain-containing protein